MSNAFDTDDTERMSRALAQALAQLAPAGLMNGDSEGLAKAALARAIIDAAESGERDEEKLVSYALAHYRQSRASVRDRETRD